MLQLSNNGLHSMSYSDALLILQGLSLRYTLKKSVMVHCVQQRICSDSADFCSRRSGVATTSVRYFCPEDKIPKTAQEAKADSHHPEKGRTSAARFGVVTVCDWGLCEGGFALSC